MFSFDGKPAGLNVEPDDWSLGATFDAATSFGADNSYSTPRTGATVPTNAIGSMEPVSTGDSGQWGGFFRDMLRGVTGYAIQRDAARNGVPPRSSAAPATSGAAAPPGGSSSNLVPLLIVGVAVVGAVVLLKS